MKQNIDELLNKGVEEVIVKDDFKKKLLCGKKLRIKHGIDPTTTDLHLGYAVVYHKLREFQEAGHKIVFLIGDFTARFGDPTDKEKTRQMKDARETKAMAKNYIEQVGKILDLKKTEIRYNSEWYDKMSASDLLNLISKFTVSRLLERDMFTKRMKEGKEIFAHEIIYPILQGYDSVMLKADVALMGTDQKFNELQARKLQEEAGQVPQDIMTVPLLIGLDGKIKMSQSLGNYIGLAEDANTQFGKIMSIPDNLILHYAELAARYDKEKLIKLEKVIKENPREAKVEVAKSIVELYHKGESKNAEANFNRIFKLKEIPENVSTFEINKKKIKDNIKLSDLLVETGMVSSKSQAKRLIDQGGVKVDKAKITDTESQLRVHDGMILQAGKLNFKKIIVK